MHTRHSLMLLPVLYVCETQSFTGRARHDIFCFVVEYGGKCVGMRKLKAVQNVSIWSAVICTGHLVEVSQCSLGYDRQKILLE
jgi:hypothetical protein